MSYNQEKKTYEFHSQVDVKPVVISADAKYRNKETKRKKNRKYEQVNIYLWTNMKVVVVDFFAGNQFFWCGESRKNFYWVANRQSP